MQNVSNAYKTILAQGNYAVETKLLVNGEEFEAVSVSIFNSLFDENMPTVGACVSGEINAEIVAQSANIPRMAKLEPFVRIVKDTQKSEWLRKGVYYIDTREENVITGVLSIHGYDAMMLAEQPFTAGDIAQWGTGKNDLQTASLIATRIGVELDSRTELGKNYIIPVPSGGESAENMREILGYIAAAYGGNWIITFDGKLLLCKLNGIPEESFYLCDNVGDPITFGGDHIVV